MPVSLLADTAGLVWIGGAAGRPIALVAHFALARTRGCGTAMERARHAASVAVVPSFPTQEDGDISRTAVGQHVQIPVKQYIYTGRTLWRYNIRHCAGPYRQRRSQSESVRRLLPRALVAPSPAARFLLPFVLLLLQAPF